MATTYTLRDDFKNNSIDFAKWSTSMTEGMSISEINQELEITTVTTGGQAYLRSGTTYDLTGSQVSVKIVNAGNQSLASLQVFVCEIEAPALGFINYKIIGNQIYARSAGANVASASYNPLIHRYLKISEDSGNIYWKYSSDGVTWNSFCSIVNPFAITSVYIYALDVISSIESTQTIVKIDDINLVPASQLKDNFNGGSIDTTKWADYNSKYSLVGGYLQWTSTAGGSVDDSLAPINRYDLTNSAFTLKIIDIANQSYTSPRFFFFLANLAWSPYVGWYYQNGRIHTNGGTVDINDIYNADKYRYLRLRGDSNGNVYMDYSTNGISWTQADKSITPFGTEFTALKAVIECTSDNEATTTTFKFDDYNILPTGSGIGNLSVQGYLDNGKQPNADDSSLDTGLTAWTRLKTKLDYSVNAGTTFSQGIVSTYSLLYTANNAYSGGVLDLQGNIHLTPYNASRGQKISADGVVSTYSLVYTGGAAYGGGVLAPNGDIHFVPWAARVGQKISSSGVVSTYSLVFTTAGNAYYGGVLSPNGDIHFVPAEDAAVGQKVSSAGIVSTYSLVYTGKRYWGGVLAPNGDIHFIAANSTPVGEKVSSSGTVSTYSLILTGNQPQYFGGVLDSKGNIHFSPSNGNVGQKISVSGVISTYSLVYTTTTAYSSGVLAPNGDIHFIPWSASVGQKVSSAGVVSTYSLIYTNASGAYCSGILTSNGDIHFIPTLAPNIQKISTLPARPFPMSICLSPHWNKF